VKFPTILVSGFFLEALFDMELAMSQAAHPTQMGLRRLCDLCRAGH
jgi:hypothetical protein